MRKAIVTYTAQTSVRIDKSSSFDEAIKYAELYIKNKIDGLIEINEIAVQEQSNDNEKN